MAKILEMPSKTVIDGFRGILDFYVYMGILCVRKWPRSPGHFRAPAVEAQWTTFAFAGSYWESLDATVKDAYNAMAIGKGVTGRDLFTKGFISGNIIKFA